MPAAAQRSPESSAWDRPQGGGVVLHPSFGQPDRRPPQTRATAKTLLIAILLSGWFHAALFGGALVWTWYHQPPEKPAAADVTTVDLSTMPALRAKVEDIRKAIAADRAVATEAAVPTPPPASNHAQQLVELAKSQNPKDAPTNAKFLSEENHKVAEETVSHDQVVAPKVLADSFKGMGDKPDQGASKFEGEQGKIGEGAGHDDRSEHLQKGRPDALASIDPKSAPKSAPDVFDPFGIRVKPHDTTPPDPPPQGATGNADHDSDKTIAGGGTKVAMAGAPSNDYLPNVKVSDKTALNAKEFIFASFWHRVQRAVEPFWVKHLHESANVGGLQRRDYFTRVDITLNADGSLVAVDLKESCGVPAFDRAAVEAFKEAAPFVNPPAGLADPSGLIHMNDLGFIVGLTGGVVVHSYDDPRSGKLFPGVGESFRGP